MDNLKKEINLFLSKMINFIYPDVQEFTVYDWKLVKSKISGKAISEKLKLNDSLLVLFEDTLFNYYKHQTNPKSHRTASLRLLLWLETIAKNTGIELKINMPDAAKNEEITFKQVRAIELILRSLIHEQVGDNEELVKVLGSIFKTDVIQKWQKSSDETGILSGTTFSELSNILLNKNIFLSLEEIFRSSDIEYSDSTKESLRFILEDIRIIRNSVAHNKRLSHIQIEALDNHYNLIVKQIESSDKSLIDIKSYFDSLSTNLFSYISEIKTDTNLISGYVEDIGNKTNNILIISNKINKKTSVIIGIVIVTLFMTFAIYSLQQKNNIVTTSIASTTDSINNKTDSINDNVIKVFNRFDQLEGALKNANPISNPKTANDFIVNAYIFKNSGESEKSIEMFSEYFKKTNTIRFDLYNDYYQLLKLTLSQDHAETICKRELNNDMIAAVIYLNEYYGIDAINRINSLKLAPNLKNYCYLLKSNEIKTEYVGYSLFPFYINLMKKRISLGKQIDVIKPFFFNKQRPLNYLREYYWGELKQDVIMNYRLYRYARKFHKKELWENRNYEAWLLNSAVVAEELAKQTGSKATVSLSDTRAYISFGTNKKMLDKFRLMP